MPAKFLTGIMGRDGYGHHHRLRPLRSQGARRREHCGARRQAVIDQNDRAPVDWEGGSTLSIEALPAFDFLQLMPSYAFNNFGRKS